MSTDATPGTSPAEKNPDDYEVVILGDGKVHAAKKKGHSHAGHGDSTPKTIGKFLFGTQSGRIILGSIILLLLLEPDIVENMAYVVGSSMLGFVIWAVFILGIFWLVGQLAESTKKKWKGVAGGDDHGKKGGHH